MECGRPRGRVSLGELRGEGRLRWWRSRRIRQRAVTDKEGGMASLDAFMALYEATKHRKWLARAQSAADYAESWIWIWNVPLPSGVKDEVSPWRNGPTVGLQGITARGAGGGAGGGGDEYLDWCGSACTPSSISTRTTRTTWTWRAFFCTTPKPSWRCPARTFGFLDPAGSRSTGRWRASAATARRASGCQWLVTNHLNSIMSLQDYDRDLYNTLVAKPSALAGAAAH